jgi:hypothetical protein
MPSQGREHLGQDAVRTCEQQNREYSRAAARDEHPRPVSAPQTSWPVGAENLCHLGRCSAERSPVSGAVRAGLGPPDMR